MVSALILFLFPFLLISPSCQYDQNSTMNYCGGRGTLSEQGSPLQGKGMPAQQGLPLQSNTQVWDFLSDIVIPNAIASSNKHCSAPIQATVFWGLVECRYDTPDLECGSCLNASLDVFRAGQQSCGDAAIRYDHCLLRYSTQQFSPFQDSEHTQLVFNGTPIRDQTNFRDIVLHLLQDVMKDAQQFRHLQSGGIANYSNGEIYVFQQCIQNLSNDDCAACLQGAINQLEDHYNGTDRGQVLRLSCEVRFATYKFFDTGHFPIIQKNYSVDAPNNTRSVNYSVDAPNNTQSESESEKRRKLWKTLIITIPAIVIPLACLSALMLCLRQKKQKNGTKLATYGLNMLREATKDFSECLGKGACGSVYLGTFPDGSKVAVKKLKQPIEQWTMRYLESMVDIEASLTHRNIAKLLGCCFEGQERILVYEYLGSDLRFHLSDADNRSKLDWGKRFTIIEGICRGLFYLHEDSGRCIAHRDLKPSNILLKPDMIPKIADFDLAKICNADRSHESTNNGGGTPWYCAPEVYRNGKFSTKTDVYSYGIVVLELVTGKRNNQPDLFSGSNVTDIRSYVWYHKERNKELDVVDNLLNCPYSEDQVKRCINVALLCVQNDPKKRPSMKEVLKWLDISNPFDEAALHNLNLQLAETNAQHVFEMAQVGSIHTINDVTISTMHPR